MIMPVFSLISKILLLLGLGWAAFEDLRTGKIHVILMISLFVSGAVLTLLEGNAKISSLLLGCSLGLGLVIISLLSRQAIGLGDGLMFMVSGVSLGFRDNLRLLLFSLTLSSAASIVLMIALKYKGKSRIPFIPFMLMGYVFLLLII